LEAALELMKENFQKPEKKLYKKAAKAHQALYPALRKVFPTIAELRESAD